MEVNNMAQVIGIGVQDFEKLITQQYFYVDKTDFIKEWWENGADVTLITRPRRFGKTLMMDMTRRFFSIQHPSQGDLFKKLAIWKEERYRNLQGTYPVIFLSMANIKETSYVNARRKLCQLIVDLYSNYNFLLDSNTMTPQDRDFFCQVSADMGDVEATLALGHLSKYLSLYYGKKVILLLDEYDTPMQEAYVAGYWKELTAFIRSLFNAAFKTNPYLERAILTGITRVGKESIFSDLNNPEAITATSEKYETSFGFTQQEVWMALEEYGLSHEKQEVQDWYDGFTFGRRQDIYNPWSILNYLDKRRLAPYWANTSSNNLIDKMIRQSSPQIKTNLESLLKGEHLYLEIDEQIVFDQLDEDENSIWSLLLASGYLKIITYALNVESGQESYELSLTNKEVYILFRKMIQKWFANSSSVYNGFIRALLEDDRKAMNVYMNKVALNVLSYFDSGKKPSDRAEPERFYHGFVLGLTVDLSDRYIITSNRESGFGRYDVMLEPRNDGDAIILEFKVRNPDEEATLKDTAKDALAQIKRQKYAQSLIAKGISPERIRSYGFAFEGKTVLIC